MAIQFCKECNNMLYPKTDSVSMLYTCLRCDISAEPATPVVLSMNLKKTHCTDLQLKQNLFKDAALPRFATRCPKCSHNECISYFEKSEDKALDSYYVCTACYNEWTD
ncbi:DNA-directed RNA polymerase II subunit RPB9 [Enteropsectra breve]|nr:DNA-directed RNA polymerase II subunit RPB9 [Enteropsectra breve]